MHDNPFTNSSNTGSNKKDNIIYLNGHKKSQASMKKSMENKLKKESQRVKVENRFSMEIDNKVILGYLAAYKEDNSVDNLKTVMENITKCRFLVPAIPDEKNRPLPRIIKNSAGEKYLPVYTDMEQIPNELRSPAVVNMPFMDIVQISLYIDKEMKGVVVNPFKENFILQGPLLEKIDEVMKAEMKERYEKAKAEHDAEASAKENDNTEA